MCEQGNMDAQAILLGIFAKMKNEYEEFLD